MCQEESKLYHKMDKCYDSRIYEKSKQYDMLCKLAEQNDFNIEEESKRFINSLSEYEIDCLYNKGEYHDIDIKTQLQEAKLKEQNLNKVSSVI